MKKTLTILALLGICSTASAAVNTASGLVNQIQILNAATSNQAKLKITLRAETGDRKVMCKNGTTNYYEASVPASGSANIVLVQSLLTAALMNQHSVDIASEWNGTYCEIRTVTFAD